MISLTYSPQIIHTATLVVLATALLGMTAFEWTVKNWIIHANIINADGGIDSTLEIEGCATIIREEICILYNVVLLIWFKSAYHWNWVSKSYIMQLAFVLFNEVEPWYWKGFIVDKSNLWFPRNTRGRQNWNIFALLLYILKVPCIIFLTTHFKLFTLCMYTHLVLLIVGPRTISPLSYVTRISQ